MFFTQKKIKFSKLLLSFLFFICIGMSSHCIYGNDFFNTIGLNVGLNTIKLFGSLSSVEAQYFSANESNRIAGGGLIYIEPGFDISAVFFIDSNKRHRAIAGFEYLWMYPKEVKAAAYYALFYKYHDVQLADFYLGYHYSFWQAPWQEVKIFAGPELMINTITKNELTAGLMITSPLPPDVDYVSESETKYLGVSHTRIGSRIRAGLEGKLIDNFYISASFTLGIYNFLPYSNDKNKSELFDSPNKIMTNGESLQPFFNYLISVQYRFQ